MIRKRGAPEGNQNARKAGLVPLKHRLKIKGLAGIDRRTREAKALLRWRTALETDLGGAVNLSAQKRALLDAGVRTMIFLGQADRFLLDQPSIINRKGRSLLPVVKERTALQDSLLRILLALGLERQAKNVPRLADFMRGTVPPTAEELKL